MIFVSVGTQKFPLDRLFKEIDSLIEQGLINEPVFAQIGTSNYIPSIMNMPTIWNLSNLNKR